MIKHITTGMVLGLFCLSANAALLSRAGGWAYYDDVLNITWLTDPRAAESNSFGVTGIGAFGEMSWDKANEWIAAMNTASYLGVNNWRLPTVTDTGTTGCNFAFSLNDCGYNVDLSTSEMAHLYYSTLGNLAFYNTSGVYQPGSGLMNNGPFWNLGPFWFWSGTAYAPDTSDAWFFSFDEGDQRNVRKSAALNAWAVRSGDIADVTTGPVPEAPVPGAVWLFGGALGALGWTRKQARRIS